MTQRWQGLGEWTRNQRVSQRHEQTASEILSPHPYGHSAELTSSSDASESKFWLCPFGAGGRCHPWRCWPLLPPVYLVQMVWDQSLLEDKENRNMGCAPFTYTQIRSPSYCLSPMTVQIRGVHIPAMPGLFSAMHIVFSVYMLGLLYPLCGPER